MKEVTLVYPHQLFKNSPAIKVERKIILIEEPFILSHNPIHRQKLIFHKLSLDAYEDYLKKNGHQVIRLKLKDYPKTTDIFEYLIKEGINVIHVLDTTDYYLEQAIKNSKIKRIWYESPMFILKKEEAIKRYVDSGKSMSNFYKKLRNDRNILMNGDGHPIGGKWSYDSENRKKLPKNINLPKDISFDVSFDFNKTKIWVDEIPTEKYGGEQYWLPYTYKDAENFLQDFLKNRFADFGSYEDAITIKSKRLFHSSLSPLINVGLLEPKHVIDSAIAFANGNKIPFNSLEGFVRQIFGWREFIRGSYENDHIIMRNKNFWNHKRMLPAGFWTGNVGILPVDSAIKNALQTGYTHHIERLMILGNFMLLNQINPDEVYKWFMAMYLDAYDWVMVPNVYGMSQFADGGIFATKPYISGSNYIKKMSDFPDGDWEEKWNALYWNFISIHREFFIKNHRLSMMPRLFSLMNDEKQKRYLSIANEYLSAEL